MCFKTAALPAPAEGKSRTTMISNGTDTKADELGDAHLTVTASDVREVQLAIHDQFFTPIGLKNLAHTLNTLADNLAA